MSWPPVYVFHHKNHLLIRFYHVKQFDDVGVIYAIHNFDFSANRLFALQIFYFVFLVNFQGNLGVMTFAVAEENKGISTLSNLLANYVVIHASIFTEQNYLFFFLRQCDGFCNFSNNILV